MDLLAKRTQRLLGSVIDSSTSLVQRQRHDVIRFAVGSPAAEAIPTAIFDELAPKAFTADAFDYAATDGDRQLRAALLELLSRTSEATTGERLTITTGGMQGLDLFGKLFIEHGDLVVIESPTYTNCTATALSYGAELLEVSTDGDGMIIDELEAAVERAGRAPKAIYVIPTFQNPAGTTMSLERRLRLIGLARRWNSMIIDDDPYGMLRFQGQEIPNIRALADADPLVYAVRTFSKIIAPGLRVGWVDTDPEIHQWLINARQSMDTCTNLPNQRLVAAFLSAGYLDDHLQLQRERYRERKIAMQSALAEHFGSRASWTDPDGGFYLWVTLPGVDTQALFPVALTEGVAYIPGPAFSPSGRFPDALRLCFASMPPDRIREGIARLRRAVDQLP
ncbi:aspartate aminotransferase [Microlunatus endophyticus]|uniref:Aspartate aminotransferase n=1 Tax=Microlunatus endophyticus TaxID=1716077 RepID=A0A917S1C2_9ACTN|nr:PLP-dependent aminotransferase family protein [Microlunatus endophyticus]GGL50499.1 aspartate aminotransferase [Microlunatus endophyticus]